MKTNQISKIKNKGQDYIISVSNEDYVVDNYYYSCLMPYVGKKLDNDLIDELVAFSNAKTTLKRQYKKIFVHSISSYELKKKLEVQNILEDHIKLIINRLKNENLLNDEDFVNYYFESYKQKKGKNAFKKFLITKNINSELINKTMDLFEEDESLALKYANSFLKNKTGSTLILKQKVYAMLVNKGFMTKTIENVLEKISFNNEKNSLVKEVRKYLIKYPNDNYKIISKLANKGYNVKEIKEILMEEGM